MIKLLKIKSKDKTLIKDFKEIATPLLKEFYESIIPEIGVYYILFFLEEKIIAQEIKEKLYNYYLIVEKSDYIGFLMTQFKEGALNISRLYLKKEHRNRGAGKTIIKLLKKHALKDSLQRLRICVPTDKPKTLKIIKHLGFTPSREIARFIGQSVYIYENVCFLNLSKETKIKKTKSPQNARKPIKKPCESKNAQP